MIRGRRDEDLDRLCDVLGELDDHAGVLAGRQPRDWLQEVDAERSWVFDQAPVSVAPTRNVVGHVQIYRPLDARWVLDVVAQTHRKADDLLVIGRLFVKPSRHDYGIARYLLRQSVKYVETRGGLPVLDPDDLAFVPHSLCAELGFRDFRTGDCIPSVLIRAE
ncbi:ribosomal protein S18 acetylase RimI-like enzyme [Geodermatophilus bullaregiensis]|uniref:GNAT family N-acetyltransferase n=1 Tax=Geodermatophilus bullaregiensis TaxID=1564160 RepID=UPI001EF7AB48|nr:GNAT family N-acetyltransferase [Geodermatophilus bullaregiensis]MBM7807499.1 ribosomal protein S18 acetylase RimI-like enzyme [Geodermatophilus bullaregiensis]